MRSASLGSVQQVAAAEEDIGCGEVPPHLPQQQNEKDDDSNDVEKPDVSENVLQSCVLAFKKHLGARPNHSALASTDKGDPIST
jgi:hypothetical protein